MPEGDSNTRYWRVQRTRPSIVASPGVEGRINLRWDPQEGSKIPCATRRDEETRRRQRREATTTCGTVQECSAGSVHESGNVRRDAANMLRIARGERGKAPRRRARAGGRQSERKSAVARMARGDQAVMASLSAPTTTLATRGARGARSATAGAPARIASPAAHLLRRRLSSTHRRLAVYFREKKDLLAELTTT